MRLFKLLHSYIIRIAVFAILLMSCHVVIAQEEETVRDSTSTTFSLGKIGLPDPNSIVAKYEYDPVTNRYIYREMLGDFNVRYPLFLTPKEFQELIAAEESKKYFKEKIDAFSGKKEGSEAKRKNLLPVFYVNSKFFSTLFGSDEIELIPKGSLEMDLGGIWSKQDNPAFSPENRTNNSFDFDQRVSLSLLGKIGTRLQATINYDTEATFAFQDEQIKLEYAPTEDDIIQSIEVGNVSMPLNSSLIQGAQSLFGVKMGLQFGKTTITGVFSKQNSETRTVNIENGGTVEDFEVFALNYDENRHYFLSHYFRDNYDRTLANYPFINSNIQITRVEVWVTNRGTNAQTLTDSRNVVALQDLGETLVVGNSNIPINTAPGAFPDNSNNQLNPFVINSSGGVITSQVRQVSTVQQAFSGALNFQEGADYAVLENARQLNSQEYTLNPQLGYISLNQRLNNDEILAVAFQYTVGGKVFQVGEFANDGVAATVGNNSGNTATVGSSQSLVVKLLKSAITDVKAPIWDLMMKNIYNIGAYRLEQEDFRLNILYTNPSPVNFIKDVAGGTLPDDVEQTTLLKVFNMDRLNPNQDPVSGGDGFFDYVPGITIDTENGRIVFTTIEPFGSHLFAKLNGSSIGANYDIPSTYNANQSAYVFRELYEETKTKAEQDAANKNYFQLKGRYKSSGEGGISIGAFNVPQGSVTVTAGGRVLQEGADYTVNYQLGRVNILDEALLASNTPIQVSTENNAVFGQQTKRYMGVDIQHKFSDDFSIGGTYLNLREQPLTQKSNYSFEPINNTILGFNINYATEVPFLTRMVNKLPNIDTDVPSNVSIRAEGAYLIAGAPKAADFDGKITTYIDDFEGAQTTVDISSPLAWELSSVPLGFGDVSSDAKVDFDPGIASGYRRAQLAWYSIDPVLYTGSRPDDIPDTDLSDNATRQVRIEEIFPETDLQNGQTRALFPLDLNYDPTERGAYNFNPDYAEGSGVTPKVKENFGGIMRSLTTTDFEQSNVEFIEFWLMDPFVDNPENLGGKIVFNLGSISEDVLKDGRKQYENGLPAAGNPNFTPEPNTIGQVPNNQSLIYAFDTEGQERINQDAGYDGLNDQQEAQLFPGFGTEDPAKDNYQYFLQGQGGILERYKRYNGTQGNSPDNLSNTNRGNTAFPTTEDVNRDNTMNRIDRYYEYEIDIFPGMDVGNDDKGYISDVREGTSARWVRFKIPIYEHNRAINGINDFRSIRFMRMYLTDFAEPILLRFGTLDLVRGDYRRYVQLGDNTVNDPTSGLNVFGSSEVVVTAVSEENTDGYVSPPGVRREELQNNNTTIREDEQSLSLSVDGLRSGDARGVYKNFNVDMRQYKNLELFLHAENFPVQNTLQDDELTAFIRMGNDFTDNFYQIELPLKLSDLRGSSPDAVWPEANRLNLPLSFLQEIKARVFAAGSNFDMTKLNAFDGPNNLKVGIKGNPSFGNIRVMMVGIKNDSGGTESGTVWFNEMRLSGLENQGGWAAVGSLDANIADFATVTTSGRLSTIGFGSIEQGPNERSKEDVKQYDFTTNVSLGQLLPKKLGLQIPFNYSRGEELITPQFDPFFEDIELQTSIDNAINSKEKKKIENRSTSYTKRQSFNLIGLRKERTGDKKPKMYDIENLTLSGTYNQTDHRDFEIEKAVDQNTRVGATYDFSFQPKTITPLKKVKLLGKSKYFNLLKDFNLNLLPTSIAVNSNINRQYNKQVFRDLTLTEGSLGLDPLYQRNFLFDWQYGINYNLTKSLNFSFTSSNNRIVKNFIDEDNEVDNTVGLWTGFFDLGDANTHNQQLQVNYELPFNKIPVLKFLRTTYSYSGNFQWTKGSEVFNSLEGISDLGNTIQNANVHTVNSSLDMKTLYKYVGLKKKKPSRRKKKKKKIGTLDEPRLVSAKTKRTKQGRKKLSLGDKAYNTLIGLVTVVKKVNVNYQQDNGILLPGYLRDPGFAGTIKPTAGFTFGLQDDIRDLVARKGWLTLYQDYNEQYREVKGSQFNAQASLGLLKGLTIDLSASRNKSETSTENFRVNDLTGEYEQLTPNTFGNYSVSTILIRTAFGKSDMNISKVFDDFRQNRQVIADRLATTFYGTTAFPRSSEQEANGYSYPQGFGKTNQAVLLPAFLSAYSGSDPSSVSKSAFRDIPLPNWDVKYTGLMNLKWFRKRFKRFSVAHGYRSNYTINQFQTNLDYVPVTPDNILPDALDQSGNFKNQELYANVNLTEQFSPLVKLDMEMKNSIKILAEWKKDRALSLSFDNNLLTEINGNEYILGLGYRIKDLTFVTRIGGKKQVLKSDLNFRIDGSLRQNETLIRYLDFDNTQVTAGQDIYSVKFTTDYALSENLTTLLFFDYTRSEYSISTAFPQRTIRAGITLRYNFGN